MKFLFPLMFLLVTQFPGCFGETERPDLNDFVLSSKQHQILEQFTKNVASTVPNEFMKTDFYLVRWLHENNFDIKKAQSALHKNLAWRKENKIDSILKEDFSDVQEDHVATDDTHDKWDRPVVTFNAGALDIRQASVNGKLPRYMRLVDRYFESVMQKILAAQAEGKEVTQAVLLVDLEGFNLRQHMCTSCVPLLYRLIHGIRAHYPRFLDEIILVNTPQTFNLLLNAIRSLLDNRARSLLKIFDANKSRWMPYLDERIDKEQRYLNYGGTRQYSTYL